MRDTKAAEATYQHMLASTDPYVGLGKARGRAGWAR